MVDLRFLSSYPCGPLNLKRVVIATVRQETISTDGAGARFSDLAEGFNAGLGVAYLVFHKGCSAFVGTDWKH